MSITTANARFHPLLWWDLAVGGVLTFTAVVTTIDGVAGDPYWTTTLPTAARIALLLAPLALVLLLYITLGRRALLQAAQTHSLSTSALTFFILLVAGVAFGAFMHPMYAMLQAIAYPMAWTLSVDYRSAVRFSVAVAAGTGVGLYLGLVSLDAGVATLTSLTTATISFAFSIAMGTWITRIHDRGESFRELAEQLHHSQDEVAALSAAAGASAERERMSRDLHDTLTQTLAGLVMLSEQTERALASGDTSRALDRVSRVGLAARAAVTEARALVATTQPMGEGGLVPAIERVAASLRADTDLDVECHLAPVTVGREREVVLLRAAQEGLANARKHAQAHRVVVTLGPDGDRHDHGAKLVIDDDGIGPGRGTRDGGFGLTGLSDRVRHVGGKVQFGERAGGGSRLVITLRPYSAEPIHQEKSPEA